MKKVFKFFLAIAAFTVLIAATPMPDIIVKGSPWYDIRAYGDLTSAVTAIGSTEKTILIVTNTPVTANTILPATMHIWVLGGGKLSIATGKTLTINGPITAGNHAIFTGTGTLVPSKQRMPVEWFGSLATAVTLLNGNAASLSVEGTQSVSESLTLPAGVGLTVLGSGMISVSAGKTLTLNGTFDAPGKQVFTGDGAAVPSALQALNADWWPSFARCIADLGSNARTVVVLSTKMLSGNLTVPSNITIKMSGGSLQVAGGTTLTINGPFEAGRISCLTGNGSYSLSNLTSRVFPEWFGADRSGVTSASLQLQKAINSMSEHCVLDVTGGKYRFTTGVLVESKPISIYADTAMSALFMKDNLFTGTMLTVKDCYRPLWGGWYAYQTHTVGSYTITQSENFNIQGIVFEGGDRATVGNALKFSGRLSDVLLSNMQFNNFRGYAIAACDPYEDDAIINYMQESLFEKTFLKNCGDAVNQVPSMWVGRNNSTNAANHNHLRLRDFWIEYSRWISVQVMNRNTHGAEILGLYIDSSFIHGTRAHAGMESLYPAGIDPAGEEIKTNAHMFVIGDADGSTSPGLIRTVYFRNIQTQSPEDNYAAIYVGNKCSIHFVNGHVGERGNAYGMLFENAYSSFISGLFEMVGADYDWLINVRSMYKSGPTDNTNKLVIDSAMGPTTSKATIYFSDTATQADVVDLTVRSLTRDKDVDGSAGAGVAAKSFIGIVQKKFYIKRFYFIPDAGLTADDTNYATVRLKHYKAATGLFTNYDITTQTVAGGGTGDWTANIPVYFTLSSIEGNDGDYFYLQILKHGTGVVVPAGTFVLEQSLLRY